MKVFVRAGLVVVGVLATTALANAEDKKLMPGLSAGEIDQTSSNHALIYNFDGAILGNGRVGTGASASVNATGAVTSVSVSNINVWGPKSSFKIESIEQKATNDEAAINNETAIIDMTGGGASEGDMKGDGASASIGATGAVAGVGFSNINSSGDKITVGDIRQRATNEGSPITNTGSITVGSLTGVGASASISAAGAVTSISVSNINTPLGAVKLGDITQHASNKGSDSTVTNTGAITLASLGGTGASASVSAVGAAAVVSYSSIGSSTHH